MNTAPALHSEKSGLFHKNPFSREIDGAFSPKSGITYIRFSFRHQSVNTTLPVFFLSSAVGECSKIMTVLISFDDEGVHF